VSAKKKGRVGSSFDALLKAEGRYKDTQAVAIKRVLAWQIEQAMRNGEVTKAEMARRMHASPSQSIACSTQQITLLVWKRSRARHTPWAAVSKSNLFEPVGRRRR
jgi:hypothetical protein